MKNLTKLICGLLFALAVLVLPHQTSAEQSVEIPQLGGIELKAVSADLIVQMTEIADYKLINVSVTCPIQAELGFEPAKMIQEIEGELVHWMLSNSAGHWHCYLNNQLPSSPAESLTYSWTKYTQSRTLNLPRSAKFSRICPLPRSC